MSEHGGDGHDAQQEAEHGHAHDAAPARWRALLGLFLHDHEHDPQVAPTDDAIGAVRLSLAVLGAVAVLQAVVAWTSGSVALLADTIHNLADALTAVPLWIAYVAGRRRANERFTYGYGRAEDLAGLFVVGMIVLSVGAAAFESIDRLAHPRAVDELGWVALAGALGFLGNEAVATIRMRAGRRTGSAALVADGEHARGDGITSLGVVAAALGTAAGLPLADPIVGLVITVALVFVLRSAALRIYHRLMDAVDPGVYAQARSALASTAGVESVGDVSLRWIGHALHAEARVLVDSDARLADAHAIALAAEHQLLHSIPQLEVVTVHLDPCGHDGLDHHELTAHHAGPQRRAG